MTSNLGAKQITESNRLGFTISQDEESSYKNMRATVMNELKRSFRPELLNRIDESIIFHKLTRPEVKEIIDILLQRLRKQLTERNLALELTDEAKDFLVDKGWDPNMGARPLRRAIQRHIEDSLSEYLIAHEPRSGSMVVVDVTGDEEDPISVKVTEAPEIEAEVLEVEN
jgi:ATP-dependent Clp protease ATP-binding subunit ClpC